MEYNAQNPGAQTVVLSPEAEANKVQSRTSMILGILATVLCWYPIGSIAGIVLGALALSRSKKAKAQAAALAIKENGMNVAGYVCGMIGVIAGSIMTLLFLISFVFVTLVVVYAVQSSSDVLPELIDSLEPIIESALPAVSKLL